MNKEILIELTMTLTIEDATDKKIESVLDNLPDIISNLDAHLTEEIKCNIPQFNHLDMYSCNIEQSATEVMVILDC